MSRWVIDWSFYFTPTSPKFDLNGSEWHLFLAWMTIGASLMAHIRDKYYTWHQYMVIESLSHWVIGLLIGHFILLLQHPNMIEVGDTILIEFLFMYKAQSQLNKIIQTMAWYGLSELTPVIKITAFVQELWRVRVDSFFYLTWRNDFRSNSFLCTEPNQDKSRPMHQSTYNGLSELTSFVSNRALVREL